MTASGGSGVDQLRFLTKGGHTDGTYGTGVGALALAVGDLPLAVAAPPLAVATSGLMNLTDAPGGRPRRATPFPGFAFLLPRRPVPIGDTFGDRSGDWA